MGKRFLFVSLVIVVSICFISVLNDTYAYSYEIEDGVLFYKNNSLELENDISKYISFVDDYIVPNSSFEMSDYLDENYDFLINFAMDYVINNREYYSEYIYDDKILVSVIYDITYKYFGIRDFYIDNIIRVDDLDYVSLVDYNEKRFKLTVRDVSITSDSDDYISAIVSYDNDVRFSYLFKKNNGVLTIRNIEVLL